MTSILNWILILVIGLAILFFVIYRMLTIGKVSGKKESLEKELYNIKLIQQVVQDEISKVTSINLYNQGYSPDEFERESRRLNELKDALRKCNTGDYSSKIFVREYIYDILVSKVQYTEETVNWTIPFNNRSQLSIRDKFDILLHLYQKNHGKKALGTMMTDYQLDEPKNGGAYYIESKEIEKIFKEKVKNISLEDKVRIITQRIYAHYKGFGVIDDIRDMSIDGVSGGVSGLAGGANNPDDDELLLDNIRNNKNYGLDAIWIMYKGNSYHMRFLVFDSEAELRRVVQNVYKYNSPGQLSETKPYIINEMADGSRITAARPPFTDSWAFFVRKKYDASKLELEALITQKNFEMVIDLIRFLMKGARTTAVTGAQGSGKTTLLISAIGDIHRSQNLRTIETAFELNLRTIYPLKNLLSFQETNNINGQMALDFSKKTDGHVLILGEVATDAVASQMIQAAQVASLFTLFTHHAKTAPKLVESIRNSLLKEGAFKDEIGAERQVAEVLEFNIHLKQDYDGKRYVERITQIIPIEAKQDEIEEIKNLGNDDEKLKKLQIIFYQKQIQNKTFVTRDIIKYQDGEYIPCVPISNEKIVEMKSQMEQAEVIQFDEWLNYWWGKAE